MAGEVAKNEHILCYPTPMLYRPKKKQGRSKLKETLDPMTGNCIQ